MGISINSLKSRWRRCPDILMGAQDAGPGSGRLRVNSAFQTHTACLKNGSPSVGCTQAVFQQPDRGYP